MTEPTIIQGGMGIAVSNWRLAREVARQGFMGVVSGTVIHSVLIRRLQDGDLDGTMRRALAAFPDTKVIKSILEEYFVPGGKPPEAPYKSSPLYNIEASAKAQILSVVASFAEVFLAKEENPSGPVGINLLEKLQLANVFCLYGAMLAGVNYVLMGAGIPREIPGILDRLAHHQVVQMSVTVQGANSELAPTYVTFDPKKVLELPFDKSLERPKFLPIISSAVLGEHLLKKSNGSIQGFVVETSVAGGHNAPPRGPMKLSPKGEPVYGPRDDVSMEAMRALGLPFWLAGGYGSPEGYQKALAAGATGVQTGSAFALANESGLTEAIRAQARMKIVNSPAGAPLDFVFTDPLASPSGFPFKVSLLEGTLSDRDVYAQRKRICDIGLLREAYRTPDNKVGLRCPAEPVAEYLKKHGEMKDTEGRKCLCNALMADIGMGQVRQGARELPLVTLGSDLESIAPLVRRYPQGYSAAQALNWILGKA